jgi:hypothetical protein
MMKKKNVWKDENINYDKELEVKKKVKKLF